MAEQGKAKLAEQSAKRTEHSSDCLLSALVPGSTMMGPFSCIEPSGAAVMLFASAALSSE